MWPRQMELLQDFGYFEGNRLCQCEGDVHSVGGGSVLEGRLELLSDDQGAWHMVNIAILNGQVHLYVVHTMDKPQVVNMLEYYPI